MTFIILDIPELFGLSIEVYFILTLIAVPTFFFCRWLFRKFKMSDKARKVAAWITTLILTPAIYIGLVLLLLFGLSYTPSIDFDRSQWLADREGRFQMATDIIKTKMLIKKDTIEVKGLLGEPTWGTDSTWKSDAISTWTYDMGFGGGNGIAGLMHNLVITFDKGHVVTVKHVKIQD